MPIYEYVCDRCSYVFEMLVRQSTNTDCPRCGNQQSEKKLSVFAVGKETSKHVQPVAPCYTCGNPKGPGSCSTN